MKMQDMGLSLWEHWLTWSPKGSLAWLPYWLKRRIMSVWNYTACRLLGHYELNYLEIDGTPEIVCVNCCRVIKL